MPELTGKNVLITGALGTIGQALVARYAEEGANVIALDRPDAANPQEVLDAIAEGVRYFGCDLNDLERLSARRPRWPTRSGGIDVLVNNAALVIFKPHEEFTHRGVRGPGPRELLGRFRPLAGVLAAHEGQALREDRQHHLADPDGSLGWLRARTSPPRARCTA